ncbi:MAG TPA: VOC family protein [Candidatus Paceibacterota bacterium]
MKITGIDFTMYKVSDLKRSIEFYKDTLGLELKSSGDVWAELWAGNDALVLGAWEFDQSKAGGNVSLGLAVDDARAARAELEKKGVKFDGDIWETPVCLGATFFDPDGNKVALHQHKK